MFDVFTGPMLELFATSLWETIVMVGVSGAIGALVGIPLGVYLHPVDKSFYGTEYTFHRSGRSGHLLVGMGGSPGPNEILNHTAE